MFGIKKSSGILARLPTNTKGKLYVSPMPYGPYDPHNRLLKLYRKHRIQTAVMLVTDHELAHKAKRDLLKIYKKVDIEVVRHPMMDFTCPSYETILMLTERIERILQHENVAIHCNAGVGRTAVVAGCLLRRLRDYSSEEAMSIIREHMQIRITSEQARFVEKFPAQQSTSWRA